MNKSTFIFYFSILSTFLFSQNNQDARMLGLNGSYTTLAIGFQSIGINPANLSVYNQRSINLFNLALRFNNNSLSIANYNSINGANLEDSTSFSYLPKALFYETFEGDGLRLKQNLFFPFPIINFSTKKIAFTSNLSSNLDIGIPNGFLDFLLYGIQVGNSISIDLKQESIITQEVAISAAHEFQGLSVGVTLKYILGLFYMGIETVGTPYLKTDITGFNSKNQYLIKQAIGGGGTGLDLGIATKKTKDGYQFGASIINLIGTVKWTQDHFMRSSLENTLKNSAGDFYLRPNEFMYFNMGIDSLTANSFSEKGGDPLIYYERYKVISVESLSDIDLSEEELQLAVELADGSYYIPSGGEYNLKDILGDGDEAFTITDNYVKQDNSNSFNTRKPVYLRLGFSKTWEDQAIMAADLVTGFSDSYGSSASWRGSVGFEILRFKGSLLRFGYSLGGITKKSLSLGYGLELGAFKINFGLAINGGVSLSTAQGLDFAIGLSL